MKAFITGVSGFIGIHLEDLLKSKGVEVTGMDVKKNRYHSFDLTDKDKLTKVILKEKPDYIFHLASPILRSDQLIDEKLVKNLEIDLLGTVNLIEASSQLEKKPRILISSTAAVYQSDKKKLKESDRLEPKTGYGLSKLTQELVGLKLAEGYKIPLMVSRSILLIGTHQAEGFVVNDLVKQVVLIEKRAIRPVLWIGNLETTRDFTDVRDGVKAYFDILKKGKSGERYNVCSGKPVKLESVVNWLKSNSRREFEVKQKSKWRENDTDVLVGDNTKLKKLGWENKISLEESLKEILDYWRRELKD